MAGPGPYRTIPRQSPVIISIDDLFPEIYPPIPHGVNSTNVQCVSDWYKMNVHWWHPTHNTTPWQQTHASPLRVYLGHRALFSSSSSPSIEYQMTITTHNLPNYGDLSLYVQKGRARGWEQRQISGFSEGMFPFLFYFHSRTITFNFQL